MKKSGEYYLVSYFVKEKETLERDLNDLYNISDYNQKFLLTTDYLPYTSYNGIKVINVFDMLLDK